MVASDAGPEDVTPRGSGAEDGRGLRAEQSHDSHWGERRMMHRPVVAGDHDLREAVEDQELSQGGLADEEVRVSVSLPSPERQKVSRIGVEKDQWRQHPLNLQAWGGGQRSLPSLPRRGHPRSGRHFEHRASGLPDGPGTMSGPRGRGSEYDCECECGWEYTWELEGEAESGSRQELSGNHNLGARV